MDKDILDKLNTGKTVKVYRAAQKIGNDYYPPMSAKVNGKLRDPIIFNEWEQSVEDPSIADEDGYMYLDKGNGKKVKARYNPYFHTSPTMLNDQFSEAQDRPNLVTMEVEIPESELDETNPYKAEKAKDSVGKKLWKAGIIQGQLSGRRQVNLSRWDKPIRIVPDDEVADNIIKQFGDKKIVMPTNVVPPNVRKALESKGIEFVQTDNKGYLVDGEHKGDHYSWRYGDNAEKNYKKHLKKLEKGNSKKEVEDFQKSLDSYMEANEKTRDDIPVVIKR